MLPSVNIRKRRSKSKISIDLTESPYARIHSKSGSVKSLISVKQASPAYKLGFTENISETIKFKDFKRSLIDQSFEVPSKLSKPEDFELLLKDRLEKFKEGDSEYMNELELFETLLDEIISTLKPFDKLLMSLKEKMKEMIYKMAKDDLLQKLEKIRKENSNLINKLNNLSDINSRLQEEKVKLEESNLEYSRIFKDNPDFLISYENIVSQMIEQCEVIRSQRKEISRLKKVEEDHFKLVKDLSKSSFFDVSEDFRCN
jgi:hypothetical protein